VEPNKILKEAQKFDDQVNRKEVHNLLQIIKRQVDRLSGNDLVLLKKYLEKIVEY
jgi:hypothetical protein